jgi:cytidine deaminase
MDINLTSEEITLVEHAKEAVVKYNTMRHAKGDIDTLYGFVISDSGAIYVGACFEPQPTICGERHAIANMVLQESNKAKIKSVVVADPVPDKQEHGTPPCGTCRQIIWLQGRPETTVILLQYIQGKEGYTFPQVEKYTMAELYPHPYEPIEGLWDNWQQK